MPRSSLNTLALSLLTLISVSVSALASEEAAPLKVDSEPAQADTSAAPEPNTTILAGLGGLALLFFATRRKAHH